MKCYSTIQALNHYDGVRYLIPLYSHSRMYKNVKCWSQYFTVYILTALVLTLSATQA